MSALGYWIFPTTRLMHSESYKKNIIRDIPKTPVSYNWWIDFSTWGDFRRIKFKVQSFIKIQVELAEIYGANQNGSIKTWGSPQNCK